MARRPPISPDVIERLRALPLCRILDALDLYWKPDPDYVPRKDKSSIRINLSIGNSVRELLITGPKFFDTRDAAFTGGGAIDLVMKIKGCSFRTAVATLLAVETRCR